MVDEENLRSGLKSKATTDSNHLYQLKITELQIHHLNMIEGPKFLASVNLYIVNRLCIFLSNKFEYVIIVHFENFH